MRHQGSEGIGSWLSAADPSVPGTHTRWSGPSSDVGTLFVTRRKLSAPAMRKETVVGTTQERRHWPGHSRDNADWEDRSRGAGQPETREVTGFPATYVRRKTPCSAKGIGWHQAKTAERHQL